MPQPQTIYEQHAEQLLQLPSGSGTKENFKGIFQSHPKVAREVLKDLEKVLKAASAGSGAAAQFPPRASSTGKKYDSCEASATGKMFVAAGWKVVEKHFVNGKTWENLEPGEVVGHEGLADAVTYFFQEAPVGFQSHHH